MSVALVGAALMSAAASPSPAAISSQCRPPTFSFSLFSIGLPIGSRLVSETDFPLCASGAVTITFHGDRATGCAAAGLCDYSGTDTWAPRSGTLVLLVVEAHRRRYSAGLVSLNDDQSLIAEVQSTSPIGQATCRDSKGLFGSDVTASVHGTMITIRLLGGDQSLLGTRCAGPLDGDVASAGPVGQLDVSGLRNGNGTADFTEARSFASHGFAGTVASAVLLRTGKPQRQPTGIPSPPPHAPSERLVTVNYRLMRLAGSVIADWRAVRSSPMCHGLGACGSTGTIWIRPRVRRAQVARFIAYGSTKRSYQDFLAALGLSRRGNPHGIIVSGFIAWDDGGSTVAQVRQDGTLCRDSTKLTSSFVTILPTAHTPTAAYVPKSDAADPLRTRCPGPDLGQHPAAIGAGGLGLLDKRLFTMRLTVPKSFDDRGYHVRLASTLALTLKRTGISQETFPPTGG